LEENWEWGIEHLIKGVLRGKAQNTEPGVPEKKKEEMDGDFQLKRTLEKEKKNRKKVLKKYLQVGLTKIGETTGTQSQKTKRIGTVLHAGEEQLKQREPGAKVQAGRWASA